MRWLSVAAAATAGALAILPSTLALSAGEADIVDYYVPRVGVPHSNAVPDYSAWAASAAGSAFSAPAPNSPFTVDLDTDATNASRSFPSAAQYLTPRFHRILPRAANTNEPARTAVYVATEQNVLAALNPRNGDIGTSCAPNGAEN